jgi:hypothetical protein
MPFTETGRSPGTSNGRGQILSERNPGRILLLSGVDPLMSRPMMGSKGPVIQADSTWSFERGQALVATGIVSDLTVPDVRAVAARRTVLGPAPTEVTPRRQPSGLRIRIRRVSPKSDA